MSDSKVTLVTSKVLRPWIESRLPDWVEPHWFTTQDEAIELAPLAEIGWFPMGETAATATVIRAPTNMKWLNSMVAGVDGLPLAQLKACQFTNGAGINAITIAEYVVMGMLTIAKGCRDVVRAQDRHDWLRDSPGKVELCGSQALLLGYGAIGKLIEERLKAFHVDVHVARRTVGPNSLSPDQWRARLNEFDWVILAVPATPETDRMIGGAFLDATEPEPLPVDHPLWSLDNAHVSMHLSGRAQDKGLLRSASRFFQNLERYRNGESLQPLVNLDLGY